MGGVSNLLEPPMPKPKPQASTSTLSKPPQPQSDDEKSISESQDPSIENSQDEGSVQDSPHGSDVEEDEAQGDLSDVPIFEDIEEENMLSVEALEKYKAAQERAGVIYISRIPPGMSPNKVRHLMSAYGEVGRIYLQQEGMFIFFSLWYIYIYGFASLSL
jgi:ESF2/ABP1 family protein